MTGVEGEGPFWIRPGRRKSRGDTDLVALIPLQLQPRTATSASRVVRVAFFTFDSNAKVRLIMPGPPGISPPIPEV